MMERTCRTCQRTYPLIAFPRYSSNGYTGYRWVCRDCVRAYRTRWEIDLAPDRAAQYHKRKDVTDRKARQHRRVVNEANYRERRKLLRVIIAALRNEGMTNDVIADLAGVHVRTIRRIMSDSDARTRFYEPTEAKIIGLYTSVKGIQR